jgi:hypothetical protein
MNQQVANKSGVLKRVDAVWTSMGYNGVVLDHQQEYPTKANDQVTSTRPSTVATGTTITTGTGQDEQIRSTMSGNAAQLYVTVFGGYYDEANKTLYRDASDKYNSPTGYEYYQNTQNGIGHRGGSFIYTPSLERSLINKWNDGFRYPSNSQDPQVGKFNRGFATDKQTIYNYFNIAAPNVSQSDIRASIGRGTLKARVKFNGRTFVLPVIDTKGPSTKTYRGTSYRVIDLTADALIDLYGLSLTRKSSKSGTIDTNIVQTIINYITYTGANSSVAEVEFFIPGITGTAETTSPTNSVIVGDQTVDGALPTAGDGPVNITDLLLPAKGELNPPSS